MAYNAHVSGGRDGETTVLELGPVKQYTACRCGHKLSDFKYQMFITEAFILDMNSAQSLRTASDLTLQQHEDDHARDFRGVYNATVGAYSMFYDVCIPDKCQTDVDLFIQDCINAAIWIGRLEDDRLDAVDDAGTPDGTAAQNRLANDQSQVSGIIPRLAADVAALAKCFITN
jgi:hypothetical protein